jgi:Methyltransferase FkbM domain
MYSQYGQDRLVVEILAGKTGGFFLDSGASDGVRCSNTALLEREYGWNGICIEPNSAFFERLVKHRRCCCVNSCLSDQPGIVDFLDAGTLGGIVGEYDPAFLNQIYTALHGDMPPVVQKTSHTIGTILENLRAPTWINYWSLDTEGSELTILKSFPFDRYTVQVITVEHNWLPARWQIRQFLQSKGYQWIAELGCDDAYLLTAPPMSHWRSAAFSRGFMNK